MPKSEGVSGSLNPHLGDRVDMDMGLQGSGHCLLCGPPSISIFLPEGGQKGKAKG